MMQKSDLIMYTTEDGLTKIEATFVNDTVWLSLDQMAELFQRDRSVIGKHVRNIFKEGELIKEAVWAKFAHTADDGKTYQVDYYNLDVIISVGYRVKSLRGTQFRIWAANILKEYMQKGFALDDERLKRLGGGNYFDELLARIRDIRSSEKVFWRKVLEIYATSIDYDPRAESSIIFFKQVQNKMHWAAHKHTAAEVIYQRADAEKEHMGLTSWSGEKIKRTDVEIAKNYLSQEELDALNKIVTAYLDIAEVHALNHEPMYMKDWLETIDDYLRMTRRDILRTKGTVTHKQALEKAHSEYEKYKRKQDELLSPVEQHFVECIEELEKLQSKKSGSL
ncbi:cell filamentation protein Fic [Lachnoclostridium sp. An169]|uniref:virulence RhuM family protein n=1 Tax=Lachnoclostridium sp. An169 TaxID=1965569 RepID=UPI000B3915D2|nr:virulence RhuM family protein [Lachnoclostridium sp. An169]OUP84320.1 cell filamentation protein Fic [Lachnoclostridium sp. An169]